MDDFCAEHLRVGGDFDVENNIVVRYKEINFVDPPGGPMLQVGNLVPRTTEQIVRIYKDSDGFIIVTDNGRNNF